MATYQVKLQNNNLQWFFSCPLTDEDQAQRWRLVNGLLLVLVVALASGGILHLLDGKALASLFPTSLVAFLYLANHKGYVSFASHSIVWLSTIAITIAWIQSIIEETGTSRIPAQYVPALYVVPILLAGTLLGGRTVAAVTVTSIAATLVLYFWVIPQTSSFQNTPEGIPIGPLINTLTLLVVGVGLGWEANRQVKKSVITLHERNLRLEGEVAERLRIEAALRLSEQRYRSLFEHNQAGVVRAQLTGLILECNNAMVRILGFSSPSDLVGKPASSIFFDLDELQVLRQNLQSNNAVEGLELGLLNKNGTRIDTLASVSQTEDENGLTVIQVTAIDTTLLKQKETALELLATHDPLTGLYNRRALNDEMARILRLCIEEGKCLELADELIALILIDVDNFKMVNDRYGHQVGDAVLQEVARRITWATGPNSYVARYGGEEIAVLLPGAGPREAEIVAERIRASVADTRFALPAGPRRTLTGTLADPDGVPITISLGVACGLIDMNAEQCADADTAQDAFISIADRGLYEAKRRGRNCVVALGHSAVTAVLS